MQIAHKGKWNAIRQGSGSGHIFPALPQKIGGAIRQGHYYACKLGILLSYVAILCHFVPPRRLKAKSLSLHWLRPSPRNPCSKALTKPRVLPIITWRIQWASQPATKENKDHKYASIRWSSADSRRPFCGLRRHVLQGKPKNIEEGDGSGSGHLWLWKEGKQFSINSANLQAQLPTLLSQIPRLPGKPICNLTKWNANPSVQISILLTHRIKNKKKSR